MRRFWFLVLLYHVWKRLPSGQRRQLREVLRREGARAARRHGPRIAVAVARRTRPRI